MAVNILGISAFYHDSAAALISDGEIIAAAQEERFSRIKHDVSFPAEAIKYVLREGKIGIDELDIITFYEKPLLKFERLLESYHTFVPVGIRSYLVSMPVWIKEKIFTRKLIKEEINKLGDFNGKLLFPEHHLSHAASAFFPSPFREAAILTVDGVGEWATATICFGKDSEITILKEMDYPHSVGLLYSSFTYFLGFKVNQGEYKLMGLAPYGDENSKEYLEFSQKISDHLVSVKMDGSIQLNMKYFKFPTSLRMIDEKKWTRLFGVKRRTPEDPIMAKHSNIALAIQRITEDILLKMVKTARSCSNCENLVMAGGVALNSVANGKILRSGIFKDIWIQPAAGDAGSSLGAALAAWHIWLKEERKVIKDKMKETFLGPAFKEDEIEKVLLSCGVRYVRFDSLDECLISCAKKLSEGKIGGFFQGRMEFGPRALGNRSILADARNFEMQNRINMSIKFREEFRPFAPAILEENVDDYFESGIRSPYMLFVHPLKAKKRFKTDKYSGADWRSRLNQKRSEVPSVTHVDYSARIQTVNREQNPVFHFLLTEFKKLTSCPVLINTSFNLQGKPIVCTPQDALDCFLACGLDFLVIENFLCLK